MTKVHHEPRSRVIVPTQLPSHLSVPLRVKHGNVEHAEVEELAEDGHGAPRPHGRCKGIRDDVPEGHAARNFVWRKEAAIAEKRFNDEVRELSVSSSQLNYVDWLGRNGRRICYRR